MDIGSAGAVLSSVKPGPDIENLAEIEEHLDDWDWRINNLYRVVDKDGIEMPFKLNRAQRRFFKKMWYRNLILKARQLGFTTFMLIFMLDAALFGDNVKCGLIAHTQADAQRLFREKLKFAYEKLPEWLRERRPARNDSAGELVFNNGSSVTVSTSYRGGTLSYLHISEFGKICRKYPEKATEIVTGAFEAVGKNCVITVESTAEGRQGYFYDFSQRAERDDLLGLQLTRLDFRFFFYPWYDDPEYTISEDEGRDVVIPHRLIDYFIELRKKHGITLTKGQMLWYALKERIQGAKMKQEYPTTPAEAFWQSVEGAYYKQQIDDIYRQGRLCKVPHTPGILVHTVWDLGVNDANVIWFIQRVGRAWHIIDCYKNSDVGVKHYAKVLSDKREELGYHYGIHIPPHDIEVREWGSDGKTRRQSAREAGVKFADYAPNVPLVDGIEAVRNVLPLCWFDEERCDSAPEGDTSCFSDLQTYRKEWDDKRGMWKDKPYHGPESNAADSFRYFATSLDVILSEIASSETVEMQQAPGPEGFYA